MGLALYSIAILAVLWVHHYIQSRKYLRGVPVPSGASWIWGHEYQIWDQTIGAAYTAWMESLNTHVLRIRGALQKPDILVVADPLAITHIMQRKIYDYPHSESVRSRIARLLGKSLGWVEGEAEHKRMRHLVASSLSPEAIKAGAHQVFTAADNLASSLEQHVLTNAGSATISAIDWSNLATLDVIGRFGFGHDFEGGRSGDAVKIMGAWRAMAKLGMSRKGFVALMFLRRFPFLNSLPLQALKAQGDVRKTIHSGVAKELLRRDTDGIISSGGNDLLTRLVVAHESGKIGHDELLDHISMFIMAGSETTSQTIGYALWELGRNPDVQRKLREEGFAFSSDPTYDDIQGKMPYLDAFARETLRMHPAAPYMERVSVKDDILPLRHPITQKDGTAITEVAIKAGQTVVIPIFSISRESAVWGDGTTFRPERWLEPLPPQDVLTKGWSNTLAFSDGPRNCIGYRLALCQFKVIIFTLIRRFEFHDTGAQIKNKVTSSMQPYVVGEEEKGPQLPVRVTIH
ncbi:hypothetical protein AX16_009088 [Volvariella volvacea WC 439]|nr:hypothetical protein AX16_009088 [Volvariella volvacea WC 439]